MTLATDPETPAKAIETASAFIARQIGLHPNVPEDIYHAMDLASYSRLKLMRLSAAHCRASVENPKKRTDDQLLGSVFDCVLLTPQTFEDRFIVSDYCHARKEKDGAVCGNPGKVFCGGRWLCRVHAREDRFKALLDSAYQSYREKGFDLEHISTNRSVYMRHDDGRSVRIADHPPGARSLFLMLRDGRESIRVDLPPYGSDDPRQIITQDVMDRANRMRDAAMEDPDARCLLDMAGDVQMSGIFRHEKTGLLCKFRTDKLIPAWQTVADVKKTGVGKACDADAWLYECKKWGYFIQSVMYPDGLNAIGGNYQNFSHIVVEDDEPFTVSVFHLKDESGNWRKLIDKLAAEYAACVTSGAWPKQAKGVRSISLSPWDEKKLTNQLLEE